jgi:hypothetical protein
MMFVFLENKGDKHLCFNVKKKKKKKKNLKKIKKNKKIGLYTRKSCCCNYSKIPLKIKMKKLLKSFV